MGHSQVHGVIVALGFFGLVCSCSTSGGGGGGGGFGGFGNAGGTSACEAWCKKHNEITCPQPLSPNCVPECVANANSVAGCSAEIYGTVACAAQHGTLGCEADYPTIYSGAECADALQALANCGSGSGGSGNFGGFGASGGSGGFGAVGATGGVGTGGVGTGGIGTGGGTSCPASLQGQKCTALQTSVPAETACIQGQCCGAVDACLADLACSSFIACGSACLQAGGTPQSCGQECQTCIGGSASLYTTFTDCVTACTASP